MKLSPKSLPKLVLTIAFVLMAGCRPTIEFESDFTTVQPDGEVELKWDVELAKGTSSSKVTISDIGEVELEGMDTITVNETKDINIRVSTFVLGMPITSKDKITITVLDENFNGWDFEDGADGWIQGAAFYPADREEDVLCDDVSEDITLSIPVGLDKSADLCMNNEYGDDEDNAVMRYLQRKVTASDDFELDKDESYSVGYAIKWGIDFSETSSEDCEKFESGKLGDISIILGAATESIETKEDDDVIKIKTEAFIENVDAVDELVDADSFDTAVSLVNSVTKVKVSDNLPADDLEDLIDKCKDDEPYVLDLDSINSQTGKVVQTPNDDEEMWLFVGFDNRLQEDGIHIYVDEIRATIIQE